MFSVAAVDDDKSPSRKLPGINGLPLSRQFAIILGEPGSPLSCTKIWLLFIMKCGKEKSDIQGWAGDL